MQAFLCTDAIVSRLIRTFRMSLASFWCTPLPQGRIGHVGEEWTRLGRLVRERRLQLGHTSVGAFADASGLSRRTINDVEVGKRSNYDQVTIRQIEYALGWNDGSISSVLAGGEPTSVEDPAAVGMPGPARLADAVRRRRDELGMTRDELAERSGLSGRMVDAIEAGRVILKPGPRAQLAAALDWTDAEAAQILRSPFVLVEGPADARSPRQFLGPRLDPDEPLPTEVVEFLRMLRKFDPTLRAHALRMLAQFTATLNVATTGGLPSVDEVLRMSEQRPNPDEPGVVRIPQR